MTMQAGHVGRADVGQLSGSWRGRSFSLEGRRGAIPGGPGAALAVQPGSNRNVSPDVADRPARILIVDDERHSRQVLEAMLGPEGFVLLTAVSGEDALAVVAQQSPDLILLDIMMAGMDGYQVTARIKGNLA